MKKLKNHFLRIKNFIWYHVITLSIAIILYILGNSSYEPIKFDANLLFPIDSMNFSHSEILDHNSRLFSALQEREAWSTDSISSENDGILQTRSIYIGIISIILSFALRNKKNDKVYVLMLVLITMFYALDIHLQDLLDRSIKNRQITSVTLNFLTNQSSTDSTWYKLTYDIRDVQYEKIHNERIPRKIYAIFCPDIVQIIFFIIPWLLIYLLLTEIIPLNQKDGNNYSY